ncbi:MAG: hypothetical protein BAJATHORv1_40351 [Candidatus Thorarchaeota archaeon]|nr:MAG: hypothetical protein BAJATHORv1_40351 [Candidatus Thorarchaeota archaeon]
MLHEDYFLVITALIKISHMYEIITRINGSIRKESIKEAYQ